MKKHGLLGPKFHRGGVYELALFAALASFALLFSSCGALDTFKVLEEIADLETLETKGIEKLPSDIKITLHYEERDSDSDDWHEKISYTRKSGNWLIENYDDNNASPTGKAAYKKTDGKWKRYTKSSGGGNDQSEGQNGWTPDENVTVSSELEIPEVAVLNAYLMAGGLYSKKSGSEKIAGQDCDVYEWSFSYAGVSASWKFYVHKKYNVLMKVDAKAKDPDGEDRVSWSVTEWKEGSSVTTLTDFPS